MYKKASLLKLRVITTQGSLSVEQLWSLSLVKLASLVKSLKKELKTSDDDDLSFLDENATQINPITQLKFDIVKDIYITKNAERKAKLVDIDRKAALQRLLEIKALRVDKAKEAMSDADLDKEIEALNK